MCLSWSCYTLHLGVSPCMLFRIQFLSIHPPVSYGFWPVWSKQFMAGCDWNKPSHLPDWCKCHKSCYCNLMGPSQKCFLNHMIAYLSILIQDLQAMDLSLCVYHKMRTFDKMFFFQGMSKNYTGHIHLNVLVLEINCGYSSHVSWRLKDII